jgi:hypothetical protein
MNIETETGGGALKRANFNCPYSTIPPAPATFFHVFTAAKNLILEK